MRRDRPTRGRCPIEEERSTAHVQLLSAAPDTARVTAIGRLADFGGLLRRDLGGVGPTLSAVLLSSDVALIERVRAMLLLVALQFVVVGLSVRSGFVDRRVKSDATLFYRNGFRRDPMRRMRVPDDEIRQDARTAGRPRSDEVTPVVLEADWSLSVLTQPPELFTRTHASHTEGPGS